MQHPCLCEICLKTRDEELHQAVMAERERCAKIALAIDSGCGNEREIAFAIDNPK